MVDVFFRKATYDEPDLTSVVFEILDATGADRDCADATVLIKPNLLLAADPEKGITTHPLIVRAVAEYVLDKGGYPVISDSPPIGSFERLLKKGGYIDALAGLPVTFRPFRHSIGFDIGEPFGIIDMAKEAVQTKVVINLAKLKTHVQMLLTLGVKNLFGCIIGLKKPEWHLKASIDREMFARLLVQIHHAVNPTITIVDGILALEGQGPGRSGSPRELGLIVGSRDAVAADMAIASVLGLEPDELLTNKMAKIMHLAPEQINVMGEFNILDDFNFPVLSELSLGPDFLHSFMRKHILQKPVADNKACKLCGECWKYCPVKAIDHNIKGIKYDYDTCIRCYCCLEICPHGAIRMKEPLMGKIVRRMQA